MQTTSAPPNDDLITANILIVKEEAVEVGEIQGHLKRRGHKICGVVGDAHEAVETVKKHRPDLVLMGIRLKGKPDGIDAAEILRINHNLPVVFLTAHADPQTLSRARQTHPLGYLLKPFDDHAVHATVQVALTNVRKRWSDSDQVEKTLEELRETARFEKKVAASNKMFFSGLCHDLRTPLGGIIGLAEVLARTQLDSHQKECLDLICNSAESMLTLIDDILDLNKYENKRPVAQSSEFSPRALLDELRAVFELGFRLKGIDFVAHIDPAVPQNLTGDPILLKRILLNLISNGLRYTKKGGVACRVDLHDGGGVGTTLQFMVKDTGVGIPVDNLSEIFEPYYQSKEALSQHVGSGLGLAVAKRFVELLGGRIEVASIPEVGSTFSFQITFPHPAPDPPADVKP